MGHAVTVYGVAALLIAASAGPVLATVRDASLIEFEELDEPQTLNDFPFLERVEPYLPPMIVDWLIIRPDRDLDLPDDVGYRVDPDGRVILVWPDGCEETEPEFREGSRCDPDRAPDCALVPLHPECVQPPACPDPDENGDCPPEPECESPEVLLDGECVPDPACDADEGADRPDHCPPEDPPEALCPPGHAYAYTGECIPTVTHRIIAPVVFSDSEAQNVSLNLELKTHYQNLSVEVERAGFPLLAGWKLELWHEEESRRICWVERGEPDGQATCEPGEASGTSGEGTSLVDNQAAPIPPGNLTLSVEYNPSPVTTSPQLDVRLFGRPTNP